LLEGKDAFMKTEQKIRDFTLRLIQIIVWFEILWAAVFLAGMVFQWSGLTDQLSIAFFGSGFCAVLVLASLALLNVTANLNIISKVQVRKTAESETVEAKPGSFVRTIAVAASLILVVVLSLWFAEWRLYRGKAAAAASKVESIADSPLVAEAIDLIGADGDIKELEKIRAALSASIQSGARLSLLLPRKVKDVVLYYEVTAWWQGNKGEVTKISEANLTKFVPSSRERENWDKLTGGEMQSFTVPAGNEIRAFRKTKSAKGDLILLLDTGRRSDYSRDSF
jgi:hypothetical protein